MFLQDPLMKEIKEGEHDFICHYSFVEVLKREERTWWDEDEIIVSDEEGSKGGEDDYNY